MSVPPSKKCPCSNSISRRMLVNAVSAAPIDWLPAKECADCADIAFMAEEVRLFLALGPETDSI